MDMKNLSKTQKLCFSGAVMAIYILLMYLTQSFAFGQYQVRIATAIYSVAYLFEFLVVPLALANLLSNLLMGGFGFFDIVGGGLVGLLTAGCCAWLGKQRLSRSLTAVPIALIPALGVASWLSYLLSAALLGNGRKPAGGPVDCRYSRGPAYSVHCGKSGSLNKEEKT